MKPDRPSKLLSRRVLGVAALASALAGCAGLKPKTPEEVVAQRAEARWAALIKGDFDGAYAYLPPSFRAVVSAPDYRKRFGAAGQWSNAIVHKVSCEAESCKATVRITTQIRLPRFAMTLPETTTYLDEIWVREEGQWWRYEAL